MEDKFYTYILRSTVDDSFYIGQTRNLDTRIEQHNEGLSKYSSKKRPWILVYFEEFNSRTEAIKRERFLKKQRNKTFYESLINN